MIADIYNTYERIAGSATRREDLGSWEQLRSACEREIAFAKAMKGDAGNVPSVLEECDWQIARLGGAK